MALITTAEAKLYLPGLTGTTEDTNIDTMIGIAGERLAQYCGYLPAATGGGASMESTAYTEYYPGPGGRLMQLRHYPVVSIATVEDDPTEAFDGSSYLIGTSDRVLRDAEFGELWLTFESTHGTWSNTVRKVIKVVYNAGYSTTPEGLKNAVGLVVRHLWQMRGTLGRSSIAVGGTSVSPGPETLPETVRELLGPYRLAGALA